MTHDVKLSNNSALTLVFNLLEYFTVVTGLQVVTLTPGAEHEFQAECCESETMRKFIFYCRDHGIEFGSSGLNVQISIIPPTVSE